MWLVLILLAQLLHRAEAPDQNAQPAKSGWPLEECRDTGSPSGETGPGGCICNSEYQVCQPLRLSAGVNESVILPCRFTYHPEWEPSRHPQVHWRLENFHSRRYLFNCCRGLEHTDLRFQGRVSLVREAGQPGQPYTASIRITALRESDSQLYFCRVSVETKRGRKAWQTINGTNLTVTASLPQPEGRNNTTPVPLGLLAGVLAGAILLAAAVVLSLVLFLLAQRKGHRRKRAQTRSAAGRGQEGDEADGHELRCPGAGAPPGEKPAPPPAPEEPGLVYASVLLPADAPSKARPFRRERGAVEETTYATVRP